MKDFIGKKYFNLVVVEKIGKNKDNRSVYKCACTCGNYTTAYKNQLDAGHKKSCGCTIGEANKTHGLRKHRLYNIWKGMISRTTTTTNNDFINYGGRGITVCERWKDVKNFIEDMYPSFEDGLSIDRIDVNGNYEPSNCRWATNKEQSINRRDTIFIELDGIKKTLYEWSILKNISRQAMYMRYRRGYSNEEIINGKRNS